MQRVIAAHYSASLFVLAMIRKNITRWVVGFSAHRNSSRLPAHKDQGLLPLWGWQGLLWGVLHPIFFSIIPTGVGNTSLCLRDAQVSGGGSWALGVLWPQVEFTPKGPMGTQGSSRLAWIIRASHAPSFGSEGIDTFQAPNINTLFCS